MGVLIAVSSTKFNSDKPRAFSKTSTAKTAVCCSQGKEARSFLQAVTCHGLYISFQTVQLKTLEEHTGSLCSSPEVRRGETRTPLLFPYQFLTIFDHQEGSIVKRAEALTGVPVGFTLWEVVAFPLEIQPTWGTEFQRRTNGKIFGRRTVYCKKTKNNLPISSNWKRFLELFSLLSDCTIWNHLSLTIALLLLPSRNNYCKLTIYSGSCTLTVADIPLKWWSEAGW